MLTLALGVAVTTAAFSIANWLLFKPVPGIRDGDRLAIVWFGERQSSVFARRFPITTAQVIGLREAVPALAELAGFTRTDVSVAGRESSRRLEAEFVEGGYFAALGTVPVFGRLLGAQDDVAPGGLPVAVISDELWAELFSRSSDVLGQSLKVNTQVFTVVGVAPPGFHGAERQRATGLWLPGRTAMALFAARGERVLPEPIYSEFVARLADGASFERAETELRSASREITGYPPIVFRSVGVWPPIRATAEDAVRLLLTATALVLLIACGNAANLMLFRGLARRARTAMRRVIGARRWDLLREPLAEAALLGFAAGGLGILLAVWCVDAFEGLRLWRGALEVEDVPLDRGVATFAVSTGVVAALGAAVAPALLAARTDPMDAIRRTSATQTRGNTLRRLFAGTQVALSLALVVGALLLARTLHSLSRVDVGFDPTGVSTVAITPMDQGYDAARLRPYYRELLARVREIPGVERVSLAFSYPFSMRAFRVDRLLPADAAAETTPISAVSNSVSPDYFETLGIPLLVGRGFTEAEFLSDAEPPMTPVVLSESLAKQLFGGVADPIGRLIGGGGGRRIEVIGVVADTRYGSLSESAVGPAAEGFMIYAPFRGGGIATLLVRSRLPHGGTMAAIRAEAGRIDSSIPLYGETALRSAIQRHLSDRILFARLLLVLSVLAVAIAGVGLYGLSAYGVLTRTRELGIRITLGANPGRVLRGVLSEGLLLGAAGIGAGLGGAYVLARLLGNRLYGVTPLDPFTYALASLIIVAASVAATLVPGRRAARVDPIVALRAE
jgi:putative ABC transport system permease protein